MRHMRSSRFGQRLIHLIVVLVLPVLIFAATGPKTRHTGKMLNGLTVLLDPGHGGRDQGAKGASGVEEEPIVLAVAQHLRDFLKAEGATVILTRETDTDLAGEGEGHRKPRDMRARVRLHDEWRADLVISIHANAVPSSRWYGAQVFYNQDGHACSKRLAEAMQAEIRRTLSNTDRQISHKLNHFILKNVDIPAVTVEVGFLSNPREERLLADPRYQKSVAWAMFSGVMRFVGESSAR